MTEKEYQYNEEQIARFAKALAHPARITILRFLASQSACYFGELHEILPLTKATVSQHLTELKNAGLVQGSFEPPKVRYCINKENWQIAKSLFKGFFKEYKVKNKCCKKD